MYSTKTSWIVILAFIVIGFGVSTCAHAEVSLLAGAGSGNFSWCGGGNGTYEKTGGWNQPPMPFIDHRRTGAYQLGLRYSPSSDIAFDVLYHTWTNVRVRGQYVHDDDYYKETKSYRLDATTYNASMVTKTDGLSFSALPTAHFGKASLYGRVGALLYRQDTQFQYQSISEPSLREAGRGLTWLLGIGVGYDFGRWTIGLETTGYGQVKYEESPVGGDWEHVKDFGLVNYMLTVSYKL